MKHETIAMSRVGIKRPRLLESVDKPFYIIESGELGTVYELYVVPDEDTLTPRGYVSAYSDAVGLVVWYDVHAHTLASIESTWDQIVDKCMYGEELS